MIYAAIDIGSNTVLLTVAECTNNMLDIQLEKQHIPRLGKGVDAEGRLKSERITSVIDIVDEYCDTIYEQFPDIEAIIITATSAVRDATNKSDLINGIKKRTDLPVRVLSGIEEAEWMYAGALSTLYISSDQFITVIDIGGGSTEIARGIGDTCIDSTSINIGCVRLTERFITHNPPTADEINRAKKYIHEQVRKLPKEEPGKYTIIGIAGTATSLAFMDRKKRGQEAVFDTLNGYDIEYSDICAWTDRVKSSDTYVLKKRYPEVMTGRADIFLAGLLILQEFFKFIGGERLIVSNGGIRHGAILKMTNK